MGTSWKDPAIAVHLVCSLVTATASVGAATVTAGGTSTYIVVNPPVLHCSPGWVLADDRCVPSTPICGSDSILVDHTCKPQTRTCGADSVRVSEGCLPKTKPKTMVPGDTVIGEDIAHRQATFRHYIVSEDYTWVLGSSSAVALDDTEVSEESFIHYLQSPGIQLQLEAATSGIIAVGTASKEGSQSTEIQRAHGRAVRLNSWIRRVFPGSVDRYTLTVGQYRCMRTPRTSPEQRKIILIAILAKDDEVDVQQALRDALAKDSAFPELHCYTTFELESHATAPERRE